MIPIDPRVPAVLVPAGSKALIIAENQQEYIAVPSVITPGHMVITRWELTADERDALIRGEDIFLTIWGTPIRPVLLTVGSVDWTKL